MTPHDHATFVPGCYRCELGRDEVMSGLAEERDELLAEIERLRGLVAKAHYCIDTRYGPPGSNNLDRDLLGQLSAALDEGER